MYAHRMKNTVTTYAPVLAAVACALALTCQPLIASAATDTATVEKTVTDTIRTSAKAQAIADSWSEERADIQSRLRDLKAREAWLGFRCEKLKAYIAHQKKSIAELERRKAVFADIKRQLEPYLDETLERLDSAVAADLPFLPEERSMRLASLHDALDDYHLPLSEKLRRVLEGLQVEAGYGRGIEATDTVLDIDGGRHQATLFRLGRVGLYCRTLDGALTAMWDDVEKKWLPLDDDSARAVRRGIDIAQRKRAAGILSLPVGGAR